MMTLRTPDLNPTRIRCVICGGTQSYAERLTALGGMVCRNCWRRINAESAPYWQDWIKKGTKRNARQ